jgi:hypothetical protein
VDVWPRWPCCRVAHRKGSSDGAVGYEWPKTPRTRSFRTFPCALDLFSHKSCSEYVSLSVVGGRREIKYLSGLYGLDTSRARANYTQNATVIDGRDAKQKCNQMLAKQSQGKVRVECAQRWSERYERDMSINKMYMFEGRGRIEARARRSAKR